MKVETCKKCGGVLLFLYYRENNPVRKWVNTDLKYCKDCKKVY